MSSLLQKGTQSKGMSWIEAIVNIAVGYAIAVAMNYYILGWWGFDIDLQASSDIALIFTVVSVFRSYLMRRIFNRIRNLI